MEAAAGDFRRLVVRESVGSFHHHFVSLLLAGERLHAVFGGSSCLELEDQVLQGESTGVSAEVEVA